MNLILLIKDIFFDVNIKYPKIIHSLYNDLPFLQERVKIKTCNILVCNRHDKNNYVVLFRVYKDTLDHRLIFKKVHKMIQSYQKMV